MPDGGLRYIGEEVRETERENRHKGVIKASVARHYSRDCQVLRLIYNLVFQCKINVRARRHRRRYVCLRGRRSSPQRDISRKIVRVPQQSAWQLLRQAISLSFHLNRDRHVSFILFSSFEDETLALLKYRFFFYFACDRLCCFVRLRISNPNGVHRILRVLFELEREIYLLLFNLAFQLIFQRIRKAMLVGGTCKPIIAILFSHLLSPALSTIWELHCFYHWIRVIFFASLHPFHWNSNLIARFITFMLVIVLPSIVPSY